MLKKGVRKMTKKKRLIATLLTVMVIFVVLFSSLFIVENANHDCIGDDCPICYEISVCENTLKAVAYAFVYVGIAALFAVFTFLSPFPKKNSNNSTSLVSLKVKLSN